MSATLPPTIGLDRRSDFEFLQKAGTAPRMRSAASEAELDAQSLRAEQSARRKRLQRGVSGVMLGLLAFTALALGVYLVRCHERALVIAEAAAKGAAPAAPEAPAAGASQAPPSTAAASPSGSETTSALANTPAPVATTASRPSPRPASVHARVTRTKPVQTRAVRASSRKLLSH
jgi:hypothetical protein